MIQELNQFLKPHQIKTDEESRKTFGRDWTTYFDIKASTILFPETTEQVQKIVLWARKNKIALIPSGGRTGLSGAAVATKNECVVSLDKMNQIVEFSAIDQTLICQAGVITETIQKFAEEKHLYYPVDFAARGSSQIGGNVATNAGGIKVVRYGMTRNWVTGLKVVTGTGEILELGKSLIKNATGYDLKHLFIGSEGTLGFITEVTLQLTQTPPPLQVLIVGVPNLESVMDVYAEFKTKCKLTAFEMFSDIALKYVTESTGLAKPFADQPFYIVIEVEANSPEDADLLSAFEVCLEKGIALDGVIAQSQQQAKNFWRLREDISESLAKYSPYKNDISVQISKVPHFLTDLDQIIQKNYPHFTVVWFGHIGDGNLHVNILRPKDYTKEQFVKECQQVDKMVYECIRKHDGAISAEHGVGLTKKPFLNYSRSEAEIQIMRSIKKVFDPDNLINPGKIFD